jgi:prepilin-type N-terminal cleavage/methylation domain-containing protein
MICYMTLWTNPACLQPPERRAVRGFTLIEAMVTVAVAAVLASVAVPSFVGLTHRFQLNSVSASLAASLQWARSEAIKANVDVIVCASNAAGSNCANSANWGANGWLVCYDANADNTCDASTTQLINPVQFYAGVGRFAQVTGPATPVRFTPSGEQPIGSASATLLAVGTWSGAPTLTTTVAPSGVVKGSRL